MKKKWKKDLLIILPVKNTVFHKFVVQLSSFYGVEFFSFFSRFSWGIPFFFSFLTRNSKPRKMRHVIDTTLLLQKNSFALFLLFNPTYMRELYK